MELEIYCNEQDYVIASSIEDAISVWTMHTQSYYRDRKPFRKCPKNTRLSLRGAEGRLEGTYQTWVSKGRQVIGEAVCEFVDGTPVTGEDFNPPWPHVLKSYRKGDKTDLYACRIVAINSRTYEKTPTSVSPSRTGIVVEVSHSRDALGDPIWELLKDDDPRWPEIVAWLVRDLADKS